MKYFSVLIKPASGPCNLRCKYCFYSDVMENREESDYGLMHEDVMHQMIDHILEYFIDDVEIHFSFQGGEPTLRGLDFFKEFIAYFNATKKEYHHGKFYIQTNGTQLNSSWYDFLKENEFLVGISLDGFQVNHDQYRYDARKKGTFKRVIAVIKKLKEYEIPFNILTVLTSQLAKYPKELWEFYQKHDLRYIQLIPCLPSFDGTNGMELTAFDFYRFYNEFFHYWYQAFKSGIYYHITLFDNLFPMFEGIPPQQCGYLGFCSLQYVVEANGDVFPCDFYVLDQYKIGNIATQKLRTIIKSGLLHPFFREKKEGCNLCRTCKYKRICNGQCKRLSVCYYDKTYCGYQQFINENLDSILEVSHEMSKLI